MRAGPVTGGSGVHTGPIGGEVARPQVLIIGQNLLAPHRKTVRTVLCRGSTKASYPLHHGWSRLAKGNHASVTPAITTNQL